MADDLTVVLPDVWPGCGRSVIVLWPDEEVLGWPDDWSCGQTTLAVQGQRLDNLGRRVAKRFDRLRQTRKPELWPDGLDVLLPDKFAVLC